MSLERGSHFGPYEVVSRIGTGGMGEVYRARDPRLDRDVALKVLPGDLAGDRERLVRFEREARAASALNHPNIITIYEIGVANGVSYIAMEFVDGWTLRDMMAEGPLEQKRMTELAVQIADGLAKAHAAGIVHRDLKPANVMVTRDGFAKILDFGLARRAPRDNSQSVLPTVTLETEPGTVFGTVGYMSPEQATAKPVDFRSDQFSFGAILYEMATGQRAFDRPSSLETMMAILKEDPKPPSEVNPAIPERLNAIITRCLAKDPKDRYWTTKNLASDLKELASGVQSAPIAQPPPRRSRPTRAGLVTVVAALLVAGAAAFFLTRSGGGAIDSLAVLPFETTSPEPDAAYLGQGIADNLIQRLSSLPNLRVISRSSVSRYRGQAVDPQKAARELKVRAVLTGTVVQRGDRLNVTAELVDARRNAHLWGKQYERRFDDILTLQEEISRDVSAELRPQRAPEKAPVANRGATTVADAYRSYLKGRYHWNKRTEADARRAIAYFQEAIERDPSYADAYDGLCDAWTTLGWYGFVPPTEAYPRAQAAARKAIEIDETVAEAHASLGGIELWFGWNWSVAEREFARTLELDPNYAPGRHWHADLFSIRGRHDEAIAESRKALELDPLSLIINTWLARRYYFARRLEDAERECRRALELDPNFPPARWQLGSVLVAQGKLKEAMAEFETAVRLSNDAPRYLGYLGNARARAGNAPGARTILQQLDRLEAGGRYVSALDRAIVQRGLGDDKRALDSIEKAFEDRPSLMPYLAIDPVWEGLRGNPRFQAVLAKLKLG